MSANLMSLGGLAIAIGLIVDAAVVVVENTVERLNHHAGDTRIPLLASGLPGGGRGRHAGRLGYPDHLPRLPAAAVAAGLEGKLFAPVAITIVFALSGSLLLSLTLIPALSSLVPSRQRPQEPDSHARARGRLPPAAALLPRTSAARLRRCRWPARQRWSLPISPSARRSCRRMDEGSVIMQTTKLPSINLEESVATDLRIQRALLEKVPEVDHVVARVGSDELGLDPMSPNETDAFLVLKPKDQWRVPE